jgi:hypothetical protein
MGTLPNKRAVLQSILDKEDGLWIIMKPSRNDPADPDDLCVFQNPGKWREARVDIPMSWFVNQEFEKIENAVLDAIENAETGYKYT